MTLRKEIQKLRSDKDFNEYLNFLAKDSGFNDYDRMMAGAFVYTFNTHLIKGNGVKYSETVRIMPDHFYTNLLKEAAN